MKTTLLPILCIILFASCRHAAMRNSGSTGTAGNLSLGKRTLISSGRSAPFETVIINGAEFDLVSLENDTLYLATRDATFHTPEGYHVGMTFTELPQRIQKDLKKEAGWGFYYVLSSGWALGFSEGSSATENYPDGVSKVDWIFKRH